jgi:hypothetical protein
VPWYKIPILESAGSESIFMLTSNSLDHMQKITQIIDNMINVDVLIVSLNARIEILSK